jgi:hypothetical protein
MLLHHKISDTTHETIQVNLGFTYTNVNHLVEHDTEESFHSDRIKLMEVGQVLVTGCMAVGFDYNGTIKDYDIFKRYLEQK